MKPIGFRVGKDVGPIPWRSNEGKRGLPRFREIKFWPQTGHMDRPWTDERETDLWVKSARRISEAYGQALRDADLHGPVGSLRIMTFPTNDDSNGVRAQVYVDRPEGWESGTVWVPLA